MIINLTQHEPSGPQVESVAPRTAEQAEQIKALLTFLEPPSRAKIVARAVALAEIAKAAGATAAMVGALPT